MAKHLIFVYGTLKRGGPNNHQLDTARFVGEFITEPLYRLYNWYGLPCLINYPPKCKRESCGYYADLKCGYCGYHCPHEFPTCPTKHFKGRSIKGEVYEVDDDILDCLDRLEGSLYERRPIELNGIEGVEAYFYKRTPTNEHSDCGSEFNLQEGDKA